MGLVMDLVDLGTAMKSLGGQLLFTPLLLLFWTIHLLSLREFSKSRARRSTDVGRKPRSYRLATYLIPVLLVASLYSYYLLFLAVRFDWNRGHTVAIEVSSAPNAYTDGPFTPEVLITNPDDISRLFDALELLEPFRRSETSRTPGGKVFVLKAKKSSYSAWSRYCVVVYADSVGDPRSGLGDVYQVKVTKDGLGLGEYQTIKLSNIIKDLVEQKRIGATQP